MVAQVTVRWTQPEDWPGALLKRPVLPFISGESQQGHVAISAGQADYSLTTIGVTAAVDRRADTFSDLAAPAGRLEGLKGVRFFVRLRGATHLVVAPALPPALRLPLAWRQCYVPT